MTIADAPYIREAENFGMPPYDDDPDYSEQAKILKGIDKDIDSIVDLLLDAEAELDGTGFDKEIRELIYKVEEIGCDIRAEAKKIHFGYDRG